MDRFLLSKPIEPWYHNILTLDAFFKKDEILQPLVVGTLGVFILFAVLRISSNRTTAPLQLFDLIVNVALGSILAGIVKGDKDLTSGLLCATVLLVFQYVSSYAASHFGDTVSKILHSQPIVIVFRGRALTKVIKRHRISLTDLNAALRHEKIWNISQVEVCILEATGSFTLYTKADVVEGTEASALLDIPGYGTLVEGLEEDVRSGSGNGYNTFEDGHEADQAQRRKRATGNRRPSQESLIRDFEQSA